MINRQDRRDFLLDTGVSPGEDDSYDDQKAKLLKQKQDLIAKHGELFDSSKILPIQRLNILIGTARDAGPTDGMPNPLEFAQQVAGKSVPTPHELNPIAFIKSIPELAKALGTAVTHPKETGKYLLENPPAPSTVAAALLPGAALKAYRETMPIAGRAYIHHMLGIPTPFTSVTKAEKAALIEIAQDKINKLLYEGEHAQQANKARAETLNDLRRLPKRSLYQYGRKHGLIEKDEFTELITEYSEGEFINDRRRKIPNNIRQILLRRFKARNPRQKPQTFLYDEANRANVAKDYENITGEKLKGFEAHPTMPRLAADGKHYDFSSAFGKTYFEPMIDQETGRIVPKAIHDTYKFYPGVYNYEKGDARDKLLDLLKNWDVKKALALDDPVTTIVYSKDRIDYIIHQLTGMNAEQPLGIAARKLAFGRPTTIIDIPLTDAPRKLNAYDKAAILLGGSNLKKGKK